MQFYIDTAHPLAVDSNDYLYPRATKHDNHVNYEFNRRVIKLVAVNNGPIWVLDFGCAGGGMVKSFIDSGHIAVGIEGSDYSKTIKRAAWATHPGYLFTADATKPFTLHFGDGVPVKFDVVTAWEFFEHIKQDDLGGVIDNILRHLKTGGWLIGSIAGVSRTFEINGRKVVYHQTVKPEKWWLELFRNRGLVEQPGMVDYFKDAWVRSGPTKIALKRTGRDV